MDFFDFGVESTGDLKIENGDFVIESSDAQHIEDIINSFPGFWKQFPSCGVGLQQYLNSTGTQQQLKNAISSQLKQDGYIVKSVAVNENFEISVDSERK